MKNTIDLHEMNAEEKTRYLLENLKLIQKMSKQQNYELRELEKKFKRISISEKTITGHNAKELVAEWGLRLWHEQREVQQIQFRSFLLSCCMVIENDLNLHCEELKKYFEQRFSVEDIKGSGYRAKKKYIESVTGKKFLQNNEIDALFEIRNIIVHNNGHLTEERWKNFYKNYNKISWLPEFSYGQIIIDKKSLPNYIKLTKRILKEVGMFRKKNLPKEIIDLETYPVPNKQSMGFHAYLKGWMKKEIEQIT